MKTRTYSYFEMRWLLCFGNQASRDRFVGQLVDLLDTNFKKVPKMIYTIYAMKQILYDMGPLTLIRWPL